MDHDTAAREFEEHRRLLTGIAYRILGSWTDAEDLVQDVWLRWAQQAHQVDSAEAWLRTVTVRAAIDQLRRLRHRRETYPGSWLPEPVSDLPEPAQVVEHRDTVSVGMLLVLEALSPLERAVFVLREAFRWTHTEIAQLLGRSPSAVRQLDHRARQHVTERRPRFGADQATARATAAAFLDASVRGDVTHLLALLAPDVVLHSDGGGEAKAPLRPIVGAAKVARFVAAVSTQVPLDGTAATITSINGQPGILGTSLHGPFVGLTFDADTDGRITALYLLVAPSKLRWLRDDASGHGADDQASAAR